MAGILDEFRLDGKVCWVTGASYGLGLAYAKAFHEAGAKKIVFNDINQDLVDRGLAAYKEAGIDAYGVVCDVTNEDQVNALVKDVEEKFGGVDILVNNAGIIKRIPMVEMTKAQWDQVISVDLTGPFVCSKAVLPGMIKKGYGKIATPQTAPLREKQPDGSMHPFDRFIRSKTPAQRWGTTKDLQGLAVFLASPASDFINGQVVYIDGGILAYIGQDPSQLDESKFKDVTGVEDVKVNDD